MKQKRKLFDELMEGVDAMQQQREGKITLRSHEVEDLPPSKWMRISSATRGNVCTSPAPCLPAACACRLAPWRTGSKGGHDPMPRPLH